MGSDKCSGRLHLSPDLLGAEVSEASDGGVLEVVRGQLAVGLTACSLI